MSISNATKYRNPMPFEDLDPYDYFSPPRGEEGVIYRKLADDSSVQITNSPNWTNHVPANSNNWQEGVFKVIITKMEYKEL